ncbi:MAG: hypothetical protein ACXAEN_19230 [Candidatus Thorarchaeota archaeon]
MSSAIGAFLYKRLPVPWKWTSIDRPHVALLVPADREVFRVFLSQPSEQGEELQIKDLDSLPEKSVVEVRHNSTHYIYYRHDKQAWTKVGEARNPFFIEIYRQGSLPTSMVSDRFTWRT